MDREMETNFNLLRGYSVYDKIAKRFMPPFFCENLLVAMRQFNTTFKKNPHILQADYQLYYIGSFDVVSGVMYDVPCVLNDQYGDKILVYDGGDVE